MNTKKRYADPFAIVEVAGVKISATTDDPKKIVELAWDLVQKKKKLGTSLEDIEQLNYIN